MLALNDLALQENGSPFRLHGQVQIGTAMFNVTGIAVREQVASREDTIQVAVDTDDEQEYADLHALAGASGAFATVCWNDRDFVLYITPHSEG